MSRPVYSAAGVPGIGSITVHRGGRVTLDGDLDLTVSELEELTSVCLRASTIARRQSRPTITTR